MLSSVVFLPQPVLGKRPGRISSWQLVYIYNRHYTTIRISVRKLCLTVAASPTRPPEVSQVPFHVTSPVTRANKMLKIRSNLHFESATTSL